MVYTKSYNQKLRQYTQIQCHVCECKVIQIKCLLYQIFALSMTWNDWIYTHNHTEHKHTHYKPVCQHRDNPS